MVPSPGVDSIVTVPPRSAARSRIPWSPRCAQAAGVRRVPSTSKPQPSSDTMAWTTSRRRWSTTLAVRAPECFAAFVSASWMTR